MSGGIKCDKNRMGKVGKGMCFDGWENGHSHHKSESRGVMDYGENAWKTDGGKVLVSIGRLKGREWGRGVGGIHIDFQLA